MAAPASPASTPFQQASNRWCTVSFQQACRKELIGYFISFGEYPLSTSESVGLVVVVVSFDSDEGVTSVAVAAPLD
jgi:hypothetical protein